MPLIHATPDVLKGITLIEIDRNQVLVHDPKSSKDGWVEYTILPGEYPGKTLEELLSQIEIVAKDNKIPIRRRPRL